MEENNRINRRSRPRPYDLRRKVLLKNFLREQMTPIMEPRVEISSQNNINLEENSVSIQIDLSEINDKDASNLPTATIDAQCNTSFSDTDDNPLVMDSNDVSDNADSSVADTKSSNDSSRESSLFQFTGLVKFKKESKKTLKGILKAKEVRKTVKSPMKTRSFKSGLERVFYGRKRPCEPPSSNQMPRSSPKSLFSLFKYRKEQRNQKEVTRTKKSTRVDLKTSNTTSKYDTINQSVQTDDSWVKEELIKVQQLNRRLIEENRLLSESLSYFMSNSSVDSRNYSSPLQSSNKNVNSSVYSDYYVPSSHSSSNGWNPRPRVSRSKSVQEYNERRNMLRNNYRTRSMHYHNYRNNYLSTDTKSPMSTNNAHFEGINIPRIRRKNGLNMPISNSLRGIQRRSSMPERTLSENDRSMVCRRSGSVRDTRSRKPFHFLPSEAFY